LKILQLIQKPQLRGAEIFACQLSNHMVQSWHEVKIICVQDGVAQLPFTGEVINLKRPPSRRIVDVNGWSRIAKEITAFQPDIVQANAGDTLKYAALSKLCFRWKAPIVFRNASTMSQYIKSWPAKKWNAFLFRQVSAVISVSEKSRQDFMRLFPFLKNRIHKIPVGIELKDLVPPSGSVHPYVLHVGGFSFEKNHQRLLHIFKEVTRQYPLLQLWLAGDGPLRTSIEQLAFQLGLSRSIKFLGYISDVLPLMQNAKAMVLPSIIEGLPGVILEAMYCRVPVIAYGVGGIPEVVKHGVTGWLVKAEDEVAFVNAIVEVMENKNYESIIEKAHQLVVNEFDNRMIAQRFLAVYHQVAARATP